MLTHQTVYQKSLSAVFQHCLESKQVKNKKNLIRKFTTQIFVVFSLFCCEWKTSVVEKVSRPAEDFLFFYTPVFVFSLWLETTKRKIRQSPLLSLEEAELRTSPSPPRSSEESASPPHRGAPPSLRFSRWISDRLFSSDRLCTTCPSSPCHTPFGTSWPPRGVSLITADVTA